MSVGILRDVLISEPRARAGSVVHRQIRTVWTKGFRELQVVMNRIWLNDSGAKAGTVRPSRTATFLALMITIGTGCVPRPPMGAARPPNRSLPDTFAGQSDTRSSGMIPWRDFFEDAQLVALVEAALQHNQELNLAIQETVVANAEIMARRGEYLPKVGFGLGAGVERVGKFTSPGQSDERSGIGPALQKYEPGLYASWEIDVWGRLRNLANAASHRYLASVEGRNFMVKLLGEINDKFIAALEKRKEVGSVFTFYASDYPQYEVVINNDVAMQKGVSIQDALNNLNILIGSTYEQGFVRFNQFYKVYVQAWLQFRRMPKDLDDLFVRNEKGDMVPYSAFMTLKKSQGLNEITRYNLYPSAAIQLVPAPGCSTGQAIEAVQQVAEATLPRGYGLGWEGLSWDESKKGNAALYIFLIVVVFVYLVLVAQYESFMIPLADACRVTWQLIEDGRAAEALPFIEPAAQRAPVNATIQEAYAIVLEKVGRDVEARSRHELSKLIRARIDRS